MTRVEVTADKDDHDDIPTEVPTVFSVDDKDWDVIKEFLSTTSRNKASSAGIYKPSGAIDGAGGDSFHDGAIVPMWTSSVRSAATEEVYGKVVVIEREPGRRAIRKVVRGSS